MAIITGTNGNDSLIGSNETDTIIGLNGNDTLEGNGGNDFLYDFVTDNVFFSGTGNDFFNGGDGDDLIYSGVGNDTLLGGQGNDTLYDLPDEGVTQVETQQNLLDGGDGDDFLYGGGNSTNSTLVGGTGNDVLWSYDFEDNSNNLSLLDGGDGNDTIQSSNGDSTVIGGKGDDLLANYNVNAEGVNIFRYALGDGNDTINSFYNRNSESTLEFGTGISQDNISFSQTSVNQFSSYLNIHLPDNAIITLMDWYSRFSNNSTEFKLSFQDGTTLNASEITEWGTRDGDDILQGTDNSDTLRGYTGDDTLNGGLGDDRLEGGRDNDVYQYTLGDGNDTIFDASGNDTLAFNTGIGSGDLAFTRVNNSLNITLPDEAVIHIHDYFDGHAIEQFGFMDDSDTLSFGDIIEFIEEPGFTEEESDYMVASSTTDPHIRTFDGLGYSFQAAGEFILTQTADELFAVQARQEPVSQYASVNTAVAVNVHDDVVSMYLNEPGVVYVNGVATTLQSGDMLDLGSGSVRYESRDYFIRTDEGYEVSVDVRSSHMNIKVRLPESMDTAVQGLFGDFDGVATDDMQLADGTELVQPVSQETLYGEYADAWRVDVDSSLFTYKAGEDTTTFADLSFPDAHVTLDSFDPELVANVRARVLEAGINEGFDLETTMLDLLLTDNDEFLEAAVEVLEDVEPVETVVQPQPAEPSNDRIGTQQDNRFNATQAGQNYDGQGGTDMVSYGNSLEAVNANLLRQFENAGGAEGDTYRNIENLEGSSFNDVVHGDRAQNTLLGGAGNDTMDGHAGDDVLDGGLGADFMQGGSGTDTATYANSETAVVANLLRQFKNTGGAAGDTYFSIENLIGSAFDDMLNGDTGANILVGGMGDDTIDGHAGDDVLEGGLGADSMFGGWGTDTISYANADAGVNAYMDKDERDATGGTGEAEGDFYYNVEGLWGSDFDDLLHGDEYGNEIRGNAGNDTIAGQMGEDTLMGGEGADMFVFNSASESSSASHDHVMDFEVGVDKLDVSALLLTGLGSDANQLDIMQMSGHTFLQNTDQDFRVMLHGDLALDMDDFIF